MASSAQVYHREGQVLVNALTSQVIFVRQELTGSWTVMDATSPVADLN